jgi:ubiquinone/menaquinone biosynthesis C-methylase UbiE
VEESEKPTFVLEVGCGRGNLLKDLSDMTEDFRRHLCEEQNLVRPAIRTVGINIDVLSTRANVEQLVADAHDLPFASERFDFVISVMTMIYLVDKLRALEEIYRVLNPGGEAFVHLPFDSTRPEFPKIAKKAKLPKSSLMRNDVLHLVKNRPHLKFPFVYSGFKSARMSQVGSVYQPI